MREQVKKLLLELDFLVNENHNDLMNILTQEMNSSIKRKEDLTYTANTAELFAKVLSSSQRPEEWEKHIISMNKTYDMDYKNPYIDGVEFDFLRKDKTYYTITSMRWDELSDIQKDDRNRYLDQQESDGWEAHGERIVGA